MTDFIFLSEPDMIKAGVLDMEKCVETVEKVFSLYGKGDHLMGGPLNRSHGAKLWFPEEKRFNIPVAGPDRRFMAMVGYLGGDVHLCGVKWYGSNSANPKERGLPRSVLVTMINDVESGEPLALMSANLVSAMRTGAVPGVASKYLAKKDARSVGIIGSGVINRACLKAIKVGVPGLETAWVYDLFPEKSKAFCDDMEKEAGIACKPAPTLEACVSSSDIISIAASGVNPVKIEKQWVPPGQLITFAGLGRLDPEVTQNSGLVVDYWPMHLDWYEECAQSSEGKENIINMTPACSVFDLILAGKLTLDSDKIINLGDIVNGEKTGRTSEDQ